MIKKMPKHFLIKLKKLFLELTIKILLCNDQNYLKKKINEIQKEGLLKLFSKVISEANFIHLIEV
jgi:hypothetical protein